MKLLLIYTKEEEEMTGRLKSLLSELDIVFEPFLLNSPQDIDIDRFTAFFDFPGLQENEIEQENIPTHILVISSLFPKWFDFLAGFAFGSHIRILIYGQEAISGISKEYASFFTFIGTEASLQTHFVVESEVYKKQDAARNIISAQQSLLKAGIPITVEALAQCVIQDRVAEISIFLTAGFSVNSRNNTGVPMLNIAARNGSQGAIRYLLEEGADVSLLAEDRGTTALIDSVTAKREDIVDDLIKAGTDLNIKDKNGQTALVIATGSSMEKMVELLLKAGADPDIPDSLGTSAKKYAALFRNEKILALFDTFAPANG